MNTYRARTIVFLFSVLTVAAVRAQVTATIYSEDFSVKPTGYSSIDSSTFTVVPGGTATGVENVVTDGVPAIEYNHWYAVYVASNTTTYGFVGNGTTNLFASTASNGGQSRGMYYVIPASELPAAGTLTLEFNVTTIGGSGGWFIAGLYNVNNGSGTSGNAAFYDFNSSQNATNPPNFHGSAGTVPAQSVGVLATGDASAILLGSGAYTSVGLQQITAEYSGVGDIVLYFGAAGNASGYYGTDRFDDIKLSLVYAGQVPEPSTWTILGFGALLVVLSGCRRAAKRRA